MHGRHWVNTLQWTSVLDLSNLNLESLVLGPLISRRYRVIVPDSLSRLVIHSNNNNLKSLWDSGKCKLTHLTVGSSVDISTLSDLVNSVEFTKIPTTYRY